MAKKKTKNSKRKRRPELARAVRRATSPETPAPVVEQLVQPLKSWWYSRFLWGLGLFLIVLLYSYWPTLKWITDAWQHEPDYSHGFLVIPLACLILSHRSDLFPGIRSRTSYAGLTLIVLAILMRFTGRLIYADFLDGWSLVPLLTGIVWYLFGWKFMKWAFPAILFLILMIPMPYQAESLLSWKLQGISTDLSTIMLRVLGQPAVAEGHVIWIYDERLLVEQACSGMRIFIGVVALAYFWAAVAKRCWLDRIIIMASAIPLAIIANATRVTLIGLLYHWFQDPGARHFIHDLTGFAMIPFAFALLWFIKNYWESLYHPEDKLTAKDILDRQASFSTSS